LIGESVDRFVTELPSQSHFAEVLLSLDPGQHATIEAQHRRADGSSFPVELRVGRIMLGSEPCLLAVSRDIRERKQAERERIEMERQLLTARKMQSLTTMAGAIAHNFNNLLGVAIGNLDLLKKVELDEENEKRVMAAFGAAKRAAELSSLMLTAVGQERGQLRKIDLATELAAFLPLIKQTVPNWITLELLIASGLPPIYGDPRHLRQLVMSLMLNGIEAIGKRRGTLALSLDHQPNARQMPLGHLRLRLRDSGPGMDQETIERAFDPFFSTKTPGRGLGLAVVQGIVRAHGGHVQIESKIGSGTTVCVRLPLAQEGLIEGVDRPGSGEVVTKPLRVLVVDDDAGMRRVCAAMLQQLGHEVLSAGGGPEAIEQFAAHSVDIVVLDVAMAPMDGWQTLAALRKRADVPALMISGYSVEDLEAPSENTRPQGVLQKPFQLETLATAIRRALTVSAAEDAVSSPDNEGATPTSTAPASQNGKKSAPEPA
jgi:two-component system cell cycle sensor histidine kinase/response regulator CckA